MLVVTYDIANDRRRARLHTLLLGYGVPVQESVFECELDAGEERALRGRVRRVIRPAHDDVRYYRLCAVCAARVTDARGTRRPPEPAAVVV